MDRWQTYLITSAAVTASAVAGSVAVEPDSEWYRSLAKPPWQPPSRAFGAVWIPLYASIAWATGHALRRAPRARRRGLATSVGINLVLNAAWNHLFFGRRSPMAGVAGTVALDLSNADLLRRTAHVDPLAAAALIPYAAWCAFATALNIDIAHRNRTGPHMGFHG